MAKTSAADSKKDQEEFAKSFNDEHGSSPEKSEGAELILLPEGGAGAVGQGGNAAAGMSADPTGVAGTGVSVGGASGAEQQLKARSAALDAREAALAKREAALSSSHVDERQSSTSVNSPGDDGSSSADGDDKSSDPGRQLADDFGDDFVHSLTRLIGNICKKHVARGDSGVAATVDQLIAELRSEREQGHFKAIKSEHDDFMEVTESPEFSQWIAGLDTMRKQHYERVIDSGSAEEIIAMLSAYKQAHGLDGGEASDDGFDDGMSAAEGVRSGRMKLPTAPPGNDDYAAAWNTA